MPPKASSVLSGADESVLNSIWELHCSSLVNCSPQDPILSEVRAAFAVALEAAATTVHTIPYDTTSFEIDLSMLPVTAAALVCQLPLTLIPLIEYLKCISICAKRGAFAAPPKTTLVVTGGKPIAYDQLGSSQLDRLVSVVGTVVRISNPRPVCVEMAFRCALCGKTCRKPVDVILEYPTRCEGRCRGYHWTPDCDGAVCEEIQYLRLQETPQFADSSTGSGINRTIEVELRSFLLDAVRAGEVVSVCGVVCTRRGTKRAEGTHQLCIRARSITSLSGDPCAPIGGQRRISISSQEGNEMREMASQPGWFSCLVRSLCPSIYGHEREKQGIVLALLGGTSKSHVRGAIHVALVGDPGLGKSQLLRAACAAAPRSIYVSANTSSSCGLTVTLTRDANTGETTFEAGAVVQGDGGITCIDEIDKGTQEHKAILEVMEQQCISLAKAGVVFSIPISTTILVAGNPVSGKFNYSRSISENLNMSPALLTRFDLIFLLVDSNEPGGKEGDVTRHVLKLHQGERGGTPLQEGQLCPKELLPRFFAYASQFCHPQLSSESSAVLMEYYLSQRRLLATTQGTSVSQEMPISPRFLQALIRVAEGRAKAELRDIVTVEDAKYAVELMEHCASSRTSADGRRMPSCPVGNNATTKKLTQRENVLQQLQHLLLVTKRSTVTYGEVVEACEDAGCKNPSLMVQQLNEFGFLLQSSGDKYRLTEKATRAAK